MELKSDPFNPIAGSSPMAECLLAGSTVDIVCTHISYPVATVTFLKDGTPVELNDR